MSPIFRLFKLGASRGLVNKQTELVKLVFVEYIVPFSSLLIIAFVSQAVEVIFGVLPSVAPLMFVNGPVLIEPNSWGPQLPLFVDKVVPFLNNCTLHTKFI